MIAQNRLFLDNATCYHLLPGTNLSNIELLPVPSNSSFIQPLNQGIIQSVLSSVTCSNANRGDRCYTTNAAVRNDQADHYFEVHAHDKTSIFHGQTVNNLKLF